MIIGSIIASAIGITLWLMSHVNHELLSSSFTYTLFFFLIAIAHGGVRLGRKVYLVDMSTQNTRSIYVALSNTVIGIVMLLAGGIGFLADILTVAHVILILAAIALFAAFYAWRMPDVSG